MLLPRQVVMKLVKMGCQCIITLNENDLLKLLYF